MARIPRLKAVSVHDEIRVEKRVPELLRVPWEKPVSGIALCNTLFEFPTHFDGQRTCICPGKETCDLCGLRPLRVYFLIALHDRNSGRVVWYQLTDRAADQLHRQLRESQKALFGSLVKIGREKKTPKSAVWVELDIYASPHGKLPKPLDPTETIERVFTSPKLARKAGLNVVG